MASDQIHGCNVRCRAPIVSHLFLANDAFLFFRATLYECRNIKEILRLYHFVSGQAINFSKSVASFSSAVSAETRNILCSELGVREVADEGSYLGMPIHVGHKKTTVFAYIKDRIIKWIDSWKEWPLFRLGKETMIKIVLQAIPDYIMNLFLLPSDLCDEIERILNGYWWNNGASGVLGVSNGIVYVDKKRRGDEF